MNSPEPRPSPPAPGPPPSWGRVSEDGTVFVRLPGGGERAVGQMPDSSPAEALAFFTKRFDDLSFELGLLEQRVRTGALGPDEATASVTQVRESVTDAAAVGDFADLNDRLDALTTTIGNQRQKRKAERSKRIERSRTEKTRIVEEAEKLAEGQDWRDGAPRLRDLLEEWKVLPRLERSADDALWRRFSSARTTYTRRRKVHFGELNERRGEAQGAKEKLVVEAEALSTSTDWGPTAGKYRDLMRRWKNAGSAARAVDDQLWARFRGAQDAFFGARDAANAQLDQEFAANAEVKKKLLEEAERLVPVTDLRAAKEAFRDLADRWDEAGKVPRERMKDLEGRMRAVENQIRSVEDDQWSRSNPEARARAADTVAQLEGSIADLERRRDAALAAGNDAKATDHEAAAEARREWLVQAQKALTDFS